MSWTAHSSAPAFSEVLSVFEAVIENEIENAITNAISEEMINFEGPNDMGVLLGILMIPFGVFVHIQDSQVRVPSSRS